MGISDRFYRNDFLEATQFDDWVFVRWVNNDVGYLSKNFIKTLRVVEKEIVRQGLTGWICESDKDHTGMHKIILKFGCIFIKEIDGKFWFRKNLKEAELCVVDQSAQPLAV